MSGELRKTWTCRGCQVRVFNVDGQQIEQPRKWEDFRCPRCRINHALKEGGKVAAQLMEEKLGKKKFFRRKIRADQPPQRKPSEATEARREDVRTVALAHPDWNSEEIGKEVGIPARSASRIRRDLGLAKARKKQVSDEDCARVSEALSGPIRKDEEIADRLGLDLRDVKKARGLLGIPAPQRRAKAARQKAVIETLRDHPERTSDEIAEALNVPLATVKKDRRELGLPTRKRGQQTLSAA